jgi:hypothetical protein
MAHSPCLNLPLLLSPSSPLYPLLLTWNPPSCDRNRPPRSQVACKLTLPCPTLHPNPPPSKFPEPQLPSASLRRPQEYSGFFCPEQCLVNLKVFIKKTFFEVIFLSKSKSIHLFLLVFMCIPACWETNMTPRWPLGVRRRWWGFSQGVLPASYW